MVNNSAQLYLKVRLSDELFQQLMFIQCSGQVERIVHIVKVTYHNNCSS